MKLKYERETEPIKEQKTWSSWKLSSSTEYFTEADMNRMVRDYLMRVARPMYVNFPAGWVADLEPPQGN